MNMRDSSELMKKYGICPECGNENVGGTPSQGSLIIEDEVFTRSCKCGWKVVIDRRIKHIATMTKKRGSKMVGGVYEVVIHGKGHKFLPLLELKERTGAKRINQHDIILNWLNSDVGRKWALEVPAASVY
jgi:hypothetical protein